MQLPFTVDAVVEELKTPEDPPPGALIEEARPKLVVLPLHLGKLKRAEAAAARAASDRR